MDMYSDDNLIQKCIRTLIDWWHSYIMYKTYNI